MIINVGGSDLTVSVLRKFTPVFKRAIKYEKMLNGSTFTSDRGLASDIYQTEVTFIGDTADMLTLVDKLLLEVNQVTVTCDGEYIFGPALDYSSSFTCNVIGDPVSFPLRDPLTTTVTLTLQIVSAIAYDPTVISQLPDIYYKYPVQRISTMDKHSFSSMAQGDYGTTLLMNSLNQPMKSREAKFSAFHTQDEMAQLQKFVSNQRDTVFTWTTTNNLTLFDNPTVDGDNYTYEVMIKDFTFKPNGQLYWDSSITLVQDISV